MAIVAIAGVQFRLVTRKVALLPVIPQGGLITGQIRLSV